jgi:processive 1,2-diacylglycerol beta-glucosyltransferase
MKKVLILTTTCGNGHNSAARTLKEEIENILGYEAAVFDPIKQFSSKFRNNILTLGYPWLMKHFVWFYNFFLRFFRKKTNKNGERIQSGKGLYSQPNIYMRTKDFEKELYKKITEEKYDAVVITYFVIGAAVSNIKKNYGLNIPAFIVNLDYTAIPGFEYCVNLDVMFTTNDEMRQKYLGLGYKDEQLVVSGIPVRRIFGDETLTKQKASALLGLHEDKKTISVLQSGFCPYRPKQIIKQLADVKNGCDYRYIFVSGGNKSTKKQTDKYIKKYNLKNTLSFAFLDNIENVFKVSDLIITKAGGLSSAEIINACTPAAVFDKLPLNEMWNRKYLTENGCAAAIDGVNGLSGRIYPLLTGGGVLQMRECCRRIRKLDTLDIILNEIKKRVES